METVLSNLAQRGIHVFPFAGFFGKDSDFPLHHTDQELWIKYTLARIAPYYNIMFNVAGPESMFSGIDGGLAFRESMGQPDIGRLGQLISQYDPFGHLITVHNRTNETVHQKSHWLSYQTLQGGKGTQLDAIYNFILERREYGKPIYAQEVFWPGNIWHNNNEPFTMEEIRRKGIILNMAQSTICYADMNGNSSTGFSGQPLLERKHQEWHNIMHKIWDFFEEQNFYLMNPNPGLVDTGYCLANVGFDYLIYLPKNDEVNVQLIEGLPYKIIWISALDFEIKQQGEVTLNGKNLNTPGEGEWFLKLELDGEKLAIARGNFPDVAIDHEENLHLVYNRGGAKYKKYLSAENKCLQEEVPGCNCTNVKRSDPDIVIDSKNNPYIFCGTEFARKQGEKWKQINNNAERDTEMAIDGEDNIYVIDRGGNYGGHIGLSKLGPTDKKWTTMPDADIVNVGNESDHVYLDLAVNPIDNSIHLVQRHGPEVEITYRRSTDGGKSFDIYENISDQRHEGPHIVIDNNSEIYVTTGEAQFFKRTGENHWYDEGKVLKIHSRYQAELSVDKKNNIYCSAFNGKYNVRRNTYWQGEKQLKRINASLRNGFTETIGARDFAFVVWEEGTGDEYYGLADDACIYLGKIQENGSLSYIFNKAYPGITIMYPEHFKDGIRKDEIIVLYRKNEDKAYKVLSGLKDEQEFNVKVYQNFKDILYETKIKLPKDINQPKIDFSHLPMGTYKIQFSNLSYKTTLQVQYNNK